MDRLSEKLCDLINEQDFCFDHSEFTLLNKALKKFKTYEDAEEQGLLLRLPCKVGDTVYVINKRDNLITEEKVRDVQYKGETYPKGQRFFMNIGAFIYFENEFGKIVFFTEAEAESALAEKGGAE